MILYQSQISHIASSYQIMFNLPLDRLLFELRSPYIENPTIFCPDPLRYAERLQVVSLYGILTVKIKTRTLILPTICNSEDKTEN